MIVHPPVSEASLVPYTVTEVPGELPTGGEPTLGVKLVIVGGVARARAGAMRDEIGINSAEVKSNSTRYMELGLRLVNSTHATLNRRARII